MSALEMSFLVAALAIAPSAALAKGGGYVPKPAHPIEACGWVDGGLPDPAETQRCLAQRYKPPKPKVDRPSPSNGMPHAVDSIRDQ